MSDTAETPAWPAPIGFGAWDSREIGRPCVVLLGAAYWMFYSGCDTWFEWKIGVAISQDGRAWQRLDDAPVLAPPTSRLVGGGWHSYQDPCVVDLDGGLIFAASAVGDRPGACIVAATSTDAIDWTEPAVIAEVMQEQGSTADLRAPWIVLNGVTLTLFATRVRTAGDGTRVTSIVRFVRERDSWVLTDTVIPAPAGTEIDHATITSRHDGGWRLWCSAFRDGAWQISTATSPDLATWSALEPAIGGDQSSSYETSGVLAPCVLRDGPGYRMWHLTSSRTSDGMSVAVVERESIDGITWTRTRATPVFTPRPGLAVCPW